MKKQVKVKAEKNPPAHPDATDFTGMIEGLIRGEIESRIRTLLAGIRKSIDEIQKAPVAEALAILQCMGKDLDEWEKKHAG